MGLIALRLDKARIQFPEQIMALVTSIPEAKILGDWYTHRYESAIQAAPHMPAHVRKHIEQDMDSARTRSGPAIAVALNLQCGISIVGRADDSMISFSGDEISGACLKDAVFEHLVSAFEATNYFLNIETRD